MRMIGRKLTLPGSLLFLFTGTLLAQMGAGEAARPVLTPKPGPEPRIHGPKVYGGRPGRPFLYRIPCTGLRPIRFSAEGLPSSLRLDTAAGIISGNVPDRSGDYRVTIRATNSKGSATRVFKLVAGDTLALTPPMGWNDWYTHYDRITEPLMRRSSRRHDRLRHGGLRL